MPKQEYTHLLPFERPIWDRYVKSRTLDIIRVEYDLHLGEGVPPPVGASPGTVAVVQATSRKRVDVVAHTPNAIYIIEIKPRAGMGALGQLLTYRDLYLEERRPLKPVKLAVVCERMAPDILQTYARHGIEVYIV